MRAFAIGFTFSVALGGSAALSGLTGSAALSGLPQQEPSTIDFSRDVLPIFKANCIGCHGPTEQYSNLRLDRRRDALRGGSIPIIVPGSGETSRIVLRLSGGTVGPQMPPAGPLSAGQIDIIKKWIDQGAQWPDELAGDAPPLPVDANANAMIDALRNGDRAAFAKFLKADAASATKRGSAGTTPLMAATLNGDATAMKLLLDAGADPNVKNEAGATALMWAVPDSVKMRLLIDRGADVNVRSDDGRTPLMIAAGQRNAIEAVRLLLDRGADASAKTTTIFGDTTPLLNAAQSGDAAAFQLLVDRGADLKAAGPFAVALAYKSGCPKCAELLLAALPPPSVNIAAMLAGPPRGDGRWIRALIERGADPNAVTATGRTLLMLAASSDVVPIDTVRALIDRGADVNARSPRGETALTLARMHGATPIVDLLVKAGAKGDAAPMSKLTPSPAASLRVAIERTLPLLQKSDATFSQKAGCVSCHHNTLTAMSVAAARAQGISVDEQIAGRQVKTIGAFVDSWRERMIQGLGIPGDSETVGYILLGLSAEEYPAGPATDAAVRFLKGKQWPDGHWEPLAHRPPLEASSFAVTAFAMRAMQLYMPAAQRADYTRAVARAAAWLARSKPGTHDDRAFHLLGLGWSGAQRARIQSAARNLIAAQRLDGGWSQLPSLPTDAYATGLSVFALRESGAVPPTDAAIAGGVRFLLNTQLADGTWFVKARVIALQPYFESGFPHGTDQWISATATNWATLALLQTTK
jgi:ankyrin repeat protein